jgi:hypothetical protein
MPRSTTSRSDTFSIRVVSVPSPTEAEVGVGAVGRITVRDFGENFPMDLTYWDVERYQASWVRALKVLERADDAVSCLISSITDPANSNIVFCWPLYRSGPCRGRTTWGWRRTALRSTGPRRERMRNTNSRTVRIQPITSLAWTSAAASCPTERSTLVNGPSQRSMPGRQAPTSPREWLNISVVP